MATITEDYVSFEIAKLLKEKGFNEPCYACYLNKELSHYDYTSTNFELIDNAISAPTIQMTMKLLREVHYIHIEALCPIVDVDTDVFGVKYNVVISNLKNNCLAFNTDIEDNEYDTYEQACEAGIKYCLENLI